jgi:hypothetical protein
LPEIVRMKKYLFLFCLPLTLVFCDIRRKDKIADDATQAKEKQLQMAMKDTTSVQVADSLYNFGAIKEGDVVEHNFTFKNTGNKPLVFPQDPIASCGCTVPKRPEKPVLPGDTAFIKVIFNSKGKSNHVVKTVTVFSNAYPSFPKLILTGDIQKSE